MTRFRRQGRFAGGLDPTVIDRQFAVPPPIPTDTPVSMHLEQQPKPRLRVYRVAPGVWRWDYGTGINELSGLHRTHGEALTLGLAAIEAHALAERVNR